MKKLLEKYPWLNLIFKYNYGLLKEEKNEKDFILGDGNITGKTIICPDGQWNKFLPTEERQSGRLTDSMGCTGYSLLNCLETLAKAQFGTVWNKSDRYLNKMSGTTRNGNTMSNVLETVRKNFGALKEEHWPWDIETFDWDEYYKSVPKNIQEIGKAWLKEYDLQYESVYNSKNLMKEALKYSPLYVAGYAWWKKGELYYSYAQANHCFMVFGYVEGSHWLAFDSYDEFIKKLDWDFNFAYVKSIYLTKKSLQYNVKKIKELQARGFKYLMRPFSAGEVYELKDDKLVKIEPQEIKDMTIISLAESKKLVGISEELYAQLIT